MTRWRVVFETPATKQTIGVPVTGAEALAQVDKCVAAFRERVRDAMRSGGCRSFVVSVHPDGAGCDHG